MVRESIARPSVIPVFFFFFRKPSSGLTPNFVELYPSTISPDHFRGGGGGGVWAGGVPNLHYFFYNLFSFSLTWDHLGGKKSTPSCQSTARDDLYQSCSNNCEKINAGFFTFFFLRFR